MTNDIRDLSWAQLREKLNKCDDLVRLQAWLKEATSHCSFTRIMRVYGRMSTVRRDLEVGGLRAGVGCKHGRL